MCTWEYSCVCVCTQHVSVQGHDPPLGAAGLSLLFLYLPATGDAQVGAKPCTRPACHHSTAGGMSVLLAEVTQVSGQCLPVDMTVPLCTRFCRCAARCAPTSSSDGCGIRAQHRAGGCSRCAPGVHTPQHTCTGTRTDTHRACPGGGMPRAFYGVPML